MDHSPPKCILSNCKQALPDLRSFIEKDFGNHTSVFGIKCKCGQENLTVSIAEEFGPVLVRCPVCKAKAFIFNPLHHGYEGARGLNEGVEIDEPNVYNCSKCKNSTFNLASGFQYSGESDILEEEDLDINPEDLFGWFVVSGKCEKCEQVSLITDIECA